MRIRSHARLAVWVGLAVLLFTPQAGWTQNQDKKTLFYQATRPSACPQVPLQVLDSQGKNHRAVFAFDTGFPTSLISDTLAAQLGLQPKPAIGSDGKPLLFAGVPAQSVLVSTGFGDVSLDIPFIVFKASQIASASKAAGAEAVDEGIIGNNVFSHFAVDFDFQRHQITLLNPGNLSSDDLKSLDMLDATMLPKANDSKQYFPIAVRLNDQVNINMLIDTGGTGTILQQKIAQQLKLKPLQGEMGSTVYGKLKGSSAQVQTLAIGPLLLKDQQIVYFENAPADFTAALGMNILSKYHLLIDYPANKLYLKPISPVPSAPGTTQGTQGRSP
jgi:aspartyl protease family protein